MVVVSRDKESFVVLIDKTDYHDKLQKMVDDGIKNGIYKVAKDNTIKDLKLFKSFLFRNFRKYELYEEMPPKSQNLTSQGDLMALQRHINSPILMK